jgi:hypothetical protein
MPAIVNGVSWNDTYRAIAFKRSYDGTFDAFVTENILNVRFNNNLSSNLETNTNAIITGAALSTYDNDYIVEEGYFWIRPRTVNINNFNITTYSLKDRQGIVSIQIPENYTLYDLNGNIVSAFGFVNEDYILIVMRRDATNTDFENAMSSLNASGIVNITFTPGTTQRFTTPLYIPNWRGETVNLPLDNYIELREYYFYLVDFKDYAAELFSRMSNILGIPVKHNSEYLNLTQSNSGTFITYTIEEQNKFAHAIYRKRGPFATHQLCTAKIKFNFYTTDIQMFMGFVNDFNWFEKLSNNITEVRVSKSNNPNDLGYYATVKWSLDSPDWTIENLIENVRSDKGYYQFQYEFSCELIYFWIRPERIRVEVDDILAIITNPTELTCDTLKRVIPRIIWTVGLNTVNYTIPPSTPNIQMNVN